MLQVKNTHKSVVAENSHPPSGTLQNGNLRTLLLKNSQVTYSLSVATLQNINTGMLQQKNTQVSNSMSVVTLPEEHQEQ